VFLASRDFFSRSRPSPHIPSYRSMLLNKHTLNITEALQPTETPLAAHTTLLMSAERREGRHLQMRIHPHGAGLQLAGDAAALLEIFGPHASAEAHFRVVCTGEDFLFGRPFHEGDDWAWEGEGVLA
jgi:hypothetical protein